jgi:hypothetical protein
MAAPKKPRDSPLITPLPDSKKFPNDKNRDIKPTEIGKPPPFGKTPDIYHLCSRVARKTTVF